MGKYYAVRKGRQPGLYLTWSECKKQVHRFPGAIYKSFGTRSGAEEYLDGIGDENVKVSKQTSDTSINYAEPFAFVDGSFNASTGVYGYGGFLEVKGERFPIMGNGNDAEMASMRNVSGEILGAMAAVRKAEHLGLKKITILYDYMGIEQWATGGWKTNKKGTIQYRKFMTSKDRTVQIQFKKVKGHSGIQGNEIADAMAKEAVGIR